ncbi:AAEL017540-PA [Aedes aegypti]|uniref:AAEL017540-PA n=1 Tax=Aedes aegypti TaxID=7159 RepID=J9HIL9_AEDAE|nr:AAEL017540-PA [Aedes aegypti]
MLNCFCGLFVGLKICFISVIIYFKFENPSNFYSILFFFYDKYYINIEKHTHNIFCIKHFIFHCLR